MTEIVKTPSSFRVFPAAHARNLQTLLLLAVAVGAVAYARPAVNPLQETMRHSLSLNDNQISSLQSPAMSVMVAVTAVPLGAIIDRASRVRLLLIFAVLNALGSLLTALAQKAIGWTSLRRSCGDERLLR